MKRNLHGLRQRWMANSMSIVTVIMLLTFGLFCSSIAAYYYSAVESDMTTRAKTAISFMNRSGISSYSEY